MGSQVSFYTDAADPLLFACRLVRRARAGGRQVGVLLSPADVSTLDGLMWSFEPSEFLPHRVWPSPGPSLSQEVLLVTDSAVLPHGDVLLNLTPTVPPDVTRFARVLEVVGLTADTLVAARHRFRAYAQLGIRPEHYSAGT